MALPRTSTSPGTHKLLGLELLRFLATISVLLWHYPHFAYVADAPVDLVRSELPFYRVLFPFYELGEYGVVIFWCISGFIFFWKYSALIPDGAVDSWTFFVNRLSRLYPLHLATLLLVAGLQAIYVAQHGFAFVYQSNDLGHFVAQLFMASDWLPPTGVSFNGPIWSVSIEVLVYAAFFVGLRFVTTSPLLNLAMILAGIASGTLVGKCFVFFYAGGLAAMARQGVADAWYRPKLEALAACAVVGIPASLWLSGVELAERSAAVLLVYTPILLFVCATPLTLPKRIEDLLQAAGNMTYSCYLLHFPIQLAIALAFGAWGRAIPYGSPSFWIGFMGLTLTAAYLTYVWFEAPAQRLIRRALQRKSEAARMAPASRP
ncbi:acyltransferase [Bradyrhizobium sp. SSBR45G]|uniref:acyltransferase family protein n=1 Tax=unclassified Bradyrhizobium TaxID=2631580 RepID=UPI002342B7DF|nr:MULTISPECIES: acyltransferase [unclassified Bradyrhizobium]GLH77414.1 acyltransferase [Bradyrhizobium sp. SSBR45G]GLH84480.1 acyltransferase [Bradyrhizobium sp. SSBR45R]